MCVYVYAWVKEWVYVSVHCQSLLHRWVAVETHFHYLGIL